MAVIGHGAFLVAASGTSGAAHTGRQARTGARSISRGERDAHGALPKRLHAARPLDRLIARSLTTRTGSTVEREERAGVPAGPARHTATAEAKPRGSPQPQKEKRCSVPTLSPTGWNWSASSRCWAAA